MKPYLICPTCGSDDVMKNGTTRRGKQNHKCRDCGRQFVEDPQWQPKDENTSAMINRLLLERIPLAGIARVLQLSESWLQQYVNQVYHTVPQSVTVLSKTTARLTVQMDELWSFVDHKGNKQWVWLALDAATREIIGCHVGDRSQGSAQALWDSLPQRYRQYSGNVLDLWMGDNGDSRVLAVIWDGT
jgi:insertion element IS1 protein InsB